MHSSPHDMMSRLPLSTDNRRNYRKETNTALFFQFTQTREEAGLGIVGGIVELRKSRKSTPSLVGQRKGGFGESSFVSAAKGAFADVGRYGNSAPNQKAGGLRDDARTAGNG